MPYHPPGPLPRTFYDRATAQVALELLGKVLIRRHERRLTVGRIVETEAYLSSDDPACHAHKGQTRKNASMFGPPGHAYVYAIHAKWCFNVVTEPVQRASAVLIRALEPLAGLDDMRLRRGTEILHDLTRGPGRLCQALAIDRALDGWDLTRGQSLWIGDDGVEPDDGAEVIVSPRIGISSGQDKLLRFFTHGNRFVSGRRMMPGQRRYREL